MLTLILGGARSGKSDLAQRLAAASGRDVLFVATMQPGDDETRARVAAHRAARPPTWRTAEESVDLLAALERNARSGDFVVVDCVTLWISNLLLARLGDGDAIPWSEADAAIDEARAAVDHIVEWAAAFGGDVVFVSNEVGAGVVPAYALGRAFRDALGAGNRAIARRADRVYYLVAGLTLDVTALGALPVESLGGIGDR
jgi:adenosylcobinamide kinase/adenosylcobinamide-phosphate guanylyltransferase